MSLYAYYNLTFNMIGVTMAYYNLTFNVIGATTGGPSQNPLACLYKPRVCGNKAELLRGNACRVWLSLAPRGAGLADSRLTSPRDPSALLREVPLPLSFCGAPPAIEKARKFQKNIYFCFIDYAKAFGCVVPNKLWKILRDDQTTLPAS